MQRKGTKIELSELARVMAEHFIGIERLLEIVRLTKTMEDPLDIIAELESEELQKATNPTLDKKGPHRGGRHGRR